MTAPAIDPAEARRAAWVTQEAAGREMIGGNRDSAEKLGLTYKKPNPMVSLRSKVTGRTKTEVRDNPRESGYGRQGALRRIL